MVQKEGCDSTKALHKMSGGYQLVACMISTSLGNHSPGPSIDRPGLIYILIRGSFLAFTLILKGKKWNLISHHRDGRSNCDTFDPNFEGTYIFASISGFGVDVNMISDLYQGIYGVDFLAFGEFCGCSMNVYRSLFPHPLQSAPLFIVWLSWWLNQIKNHHSCHLFSHFEWDGSLRPCLVSFKWANTLFVDLSTWIDWSLCIPQNLRDAPQPPNSEPSFNLRIAFESSKSIQLFEL